MKVVYYDILENLLNDIKERITKNVKVNKIKKELIVENQRIKYDEVDIELRSFSKPFFIENQIQLDLSECEESMKERLFEISNSYTDRELEAIIHKMPILKKYSSNKRKDLKDVAVIWRDHFLEDNIGLLTSFIRMGVEPSDIMVIDKGDSTKHRSEITSTFKKLGFQVELLDNNTLEEEELLKKGIKIIDKFITDRNNKKILILDDGAIISKILVDKKYENVKAVIELTEMGLRRIKKIKLEKLGYPVLNVAKTDLKKFITYKEISNTIFIRIIELLGDEKISGRVLIQLGYGDLGETLAKRFRQYGVKVIIVDTNIMKLIKAGEEGFTTYRTLEEAVKNEKPFIIVGASGEESISSSAIMMLKDECYVTAGATADLSVFKELENKGIRHKFIPNYGTQYYINGNKITVLGNGRSINLFNSESIPNRAIDIFKAGTLVTANMAIQEENKINNNLQLDIVNRWIEDSKILELYYDLYLSKL